MQAGARGSALTRTGRRSRPRASCWTDGDLDRAPSLQLPAPRRRGASRWIPTCSAGFEANGKKVVMRAFVAYTSAAGRERKRSRSARASWRWLTAEALLLERGIDYSLPLIETLYYSVGDVDAAISSASLQRPTVQFGPKFSSALSPHHIAALVTRIFCVNSPTFIYQVSSVYMPKFSRLQQADLEQQQNIGAN